MLDLDTIRAEFATFLRSDPKSRFLMDAALDRIITIAYEKGLVDGRELFNQEAHNRSIEQCATTCRAIYEDAETLDIALGARRCEVDIKALKETGEGRNDVSHS